MNGSNRQVPANVKRVQQLPAPAVKVLKRPATDKTFARNR